MFYRVDTKAVYEKLYTACTVVKTGLNESIVKDCFPGTQYQTEFHFV